MPYTPKENQRFLDRLIAERELPLTEVIAIFADRKGRVRRDALEPTLLHLQTGELFALLDPQGQAVWWEDAVFEHPEDYRVRFNGVVGRENLMAGRFCDQPDPQANTTIAPGYVWASVRRTEPLRIVGEPDGATLLAERIRAFTHQFAFHLVSGQHERIAALYSARAAKGQTLATLVTRIGNLEREFGRFDYFDHVEVIAVYNGDVSGVDASAHMRLPRGVQRNEQRGDARFQIISVRTPNGMFINEYTVQLAIIEEDGLFRIVDASAYAGY